MYSNGKLDIYGKKPLGITIIAKSSSGNIKFDQIKKENFFAAYSSRLNIKPQNYFILANLKPIYFSVNQAKINTNNIYLENSDIGVLHRSEAGSLWRICVLLALLCYLVELWLGRNIKP